VVWQNRVVRFEQIFGAVRLPHQTGGVRAYIRLVFIHLPLILLIPSFCIAELYRTSEIFVVLRFVTINNMSHFGALRTPKRYITALNTDGKSMFNTSIADTVVLYGESSPDPSKKAAGSDISPTARSSSCISYTTGPPPVSLADNADVSAYAAYQSANATLPLPFTFSGGTTTHYSELGPGLVTPMHRTVSIDQIVVLEGVLELILDGGDKRVLNRGDMVVQRGTMHAWRNPSETEWVRFFAVVQPIVPIEVDGKELGVEYHGIPDV
jgi:hypothetical protein